MLPLAGECRFIGSGVSFPLVDCGHHHSPTPVNGLILGSVTRKQQKGKRGEMEGGQKKEGMEGGGKEVVKEGERKGRIEKGRVCAHLWSQHLED